MGLDLRFNKAEALAAGLVIKLIPRNGMYDPEDNPEYIAWCKGSAECIQVPEAGHWIENDSGSEEWIQVRANKWGISYAPLTKWLKSHGINYASF